MSLSPRDTMALEKMPALVSCDLVIFHEDILFSFWWSAKESRDGDEQTGQIPLLVRGNNFLGVDFPFCLNPFCGKKRKITHQMAQSSYLSLCLATRSGTSKTFCLSSSSWMEMASKQKGSTYVILLLPFCRMLLFNSIKLPASVLPFLIYGTY